MNQISISTNSSSFQEWTNFMTDLNNKKVSAASFLNKADSANQIINNLEKELLRPDASAVIKLVLIKKQLSFEFPIAA